MSKMTQPYPCAQCHETDFTAPLCATCDIWFCHTCTADIQRNPLVHNDWLPCRKIDGNACTPDARI